MSSPAESRQHRRFTVDIEATVTAGDRRLASRARDLSRSGMCIITPEAVSGGTEITIELVLALGENAFSEPLKVDGRVVWSTPIAGSFQVGVIFVALDEERAQFLDMFLRFLDGTLTPAGAVEEEDVDLEDKEDKDDPFRP